MNQSLTYELNQVVPDAVATGLFVSLCTILAPPTAQGPTGNPSGSWTPVSGLVDIPCMDAPPSMQRVQATEVKAVAEIMSMGLRHVLLSDCFSDAQAWTANEPGWAGKNYRAVIDGVTYDLLGAENDSQGQMTRLDLRLTTL